MNFLNEERNRKKKCSRNPISLINFYEISNSLINLFKIVKKREKKKKDTGWRKLCNRVESLAKSRRNIFT